MNPRFELTRSWRHDIGIVGDKRLPGTKRGRCRRAHDHGQRVPRWRSCESRALATIESIADSSLPAAAARRSSMQATVRSSAAKRLAEQLALAPRFCRRRAAAQRALGQ
jgi:hypothetical protein